MLIINPQPTGTGPGGYPTPIVAAYRFGDSWDFQSSDGATQEFITSPLGMRPEKVDGVWTWVDDQ